LKRKGNGEMGKASGRFIEEGEEVDNSLTVAPCCTIVSSGHSKRIQNDNSSHQDAYGNISDGGEVDASLRRVW